LHSSNYIELKQTKKKTNSIISHVQNTTAIQPNVFVTGIHLLLATNKRQSAFASANLCQGQLQTSQSTAVPSSVSYDIPSDILHKIFSIMMKKWGWFGQGL